MEDERGEMSAGGTEGMVDVGSAWREFGHRLHAYVRRRVSPGEVDDIVQSVMMKLLERRRQVASESVRAWLFAVTRNAIAEHYRGRPGMVHLESFDGLAGETAGDNELALQALSVCLEPMLATLGVADAELLRQVDLEDRPQTGLAERLGVPVSTLKSRVQRARKKLRAAFAACCDMESVREGSLPSCAGPCAYGTDVTADPGQGPRTEPDAATKR